ncbi:MAG: DUF4160 domain-containing protein [Planctomycetota bacterium]
MYDRPTPEISRFLGVVVRMYYRDHAPPHFHASYGEYEVIIEIDSGVAEGRFPRRALSAVLDWHALHQQELRDNWDRARREEPIEPLE